MDKFKLVAPYSPMGDQIEAIKRISENLEMGIKEQTLLGATGTGKTFTMANVIANVNKPTIVLAHNKTLAGQLYAELKSFFPENRVEYFISYYDYYQPEAYVPSKDMYIEKDSSINDEIDQMRHAATSSILERKDTIIVASVSCIYGIGDPEDYKDSMLTIRKGETLNRDALLERLVKMQFIYSTIAFERGMFRVKGDNVDILPTYESTEAIRISFFDDEVERISIFDIVTGKVIRSTGLINIFPATHFVMNEAKKEEALRRIKEELDERIKYFNDNGKPLEAERIKQRTMYDIEMIKEVGSCSGIENYSRHLSLRQEGETPSVLLDFFGNDYLMIIDESHVTIPQVRGMYNGDRSRKQTLVDYGFRLPSALDNRPLNFEEFEQEINQIICTSATPGDYELEKANFKVSEQIIRPTGLLDPMIIVKPSTNQIYDLINEINTRIARHERTMIVTLTIKMAEDLTAFLKDKGIKTVYMHSECKTLERSEIIYQLRKGKYDVLVGINLLREGLDIPEVSLIAILDADKEGFLRSTRSLIQVVGRAARNANGEAIMYADNITESMHNCIEETERRREIQKKYNDEMGIIPQTIIKEIRPPIHNITSETEEFVTKGKLTKTEFERKIKMVEKEMKEAAKNFDFERAIELRDILFELKAQK